MDSRSRPTAQLAARDDWRADIERQVRAEVMSQAERIYACERERGYADGHADAIASANATAAKEIERVREELRTRFEAQLRRVHAALTRIRDEISEAAGDMADE